MLDRHRNLSLKLSDVEIAQAHALANDGDESVGRMLRRWLAREYEKRFGNSTPPTPKIRIGRPRAKRRATPTIRAGCPRTKRRAT